MKGWEPQTILEREYIPRAMFKKISISLGSGKGFIVPIEKGNHDTGTTASFKVAKPHKPA